MASWKFLWVPDDTLTAENSAGSATIAATAAVNYSAGVWAGANGILVPTNQKLTTANTTNMAEADAGSMLVRFRRTTDSGSLQGIAALGTYGSGIFYYLRITNLDVLQVTTRRGGGAAGFPATDDQVVGTGTDHTAYLEWNGTNFKVALDKDAGTTGTGGPYQSGDIFGVTNPATFGSTVDGSTYSQYLQGRIDAVAIFDGPLTDAEREFLIDQTEPWTFGMSLEPPPPEPPVVSAGADDAVVVNVEWTRTATITDADSSSWTATADYDDGVGPVAATVDGTDVLLVNTWDTTGVYDVLVTVTDDDDLEGTDTVQVTVALDDITGGFIVSEITGTHPTAPRISLM